MIVNSVLKDCSNIVFTDELTIYHSIFKNDFVIPKIIELFFDDVKFTYNYNNLYFQGSVGIVACYRNNVTNKCIAVKFMNNELCKKQHLKYYWLVDREIEFCSKQCNNVPSIVKLFVSSGF